MNKIILTTAVSLLTLSVRADDSASMDNAGKLTLNPPNQAQNAPGTKNFGLGLVVGEPTGGAFKFWLNSSLAVDGAVGWSFYDHTDLALHSDVLWHWFDLLPNPSNGQLPVYLGLGGEARLRDSHYDDEFGLRIPVGVDYILDNAPVDFFLEVAPVVELTPVIRGGITADIGIRYWF